MQSKRGPSAIYTHAPAEKRLRSNLTDLFLTNALSAARCGSLLVDAEAAVTQLALARLVSHLALLPLVVGFSPRQV